MIDVCVVVLLQTAHGTSSLAESGARMLSSYSLPYSKLVPRVVMFEGSGSCGMHSLLDGPPKRVAYDE